MTMNMATIGTKEAAKRLELSQATVAKMCREGKLEGAEQDSKGCPWHIPEKTIEKIMNNKNKKNMEI